MRVDVPTGVRLKQYVLGLIAVICLLGALLLLHMTSVLLFMTTGSVETYVLAAVMTIGALAIACLGVILILRIRATARSYENAYIKSLAGSNNEPNQARSADRE